jgi:hypothetical protein
LLTKYPSPGAASPSGNQHSRHAFTPSTFQRPLLLHHVAESDVDHTVLAENVGVLGIALAVERANENRHCGPGPGSSSNSSE